MRWTDIFSIVLNFISFFHIISQKMNICSKKTNNTNNKASGHQSKGLKRSKSTEHLMPKKSTKKALQRSGSEENFHPSSLSKTKSTKSLKAKPKRQTKSEHSTKKSKPKKQLDTKTVKKFNHHLELPQGNSILTQTDDADSKKMAKQYFIYCNNYIPIENSAQRRLVYKIQMIDLQNKTTLNNFNRSKFQSREVCTQQIETKEIAIGQTQECQHRQIQTQLVKIQKQKFEQTIQKCFVDVLTDLQFLYLPNQSNFQPFTQHERVHYGEMLQALAKKMLAGNKNVVITNSLTDDQVTVLLYQREGIQVGALQFIPLQGFPTHLLSILAYLKNLFCYIQYAHKQEVIANLRRFYGLNYYDRISRLSKRQPHTKDSRAVLSDQIFQAFQFQMFKDYEFSSQVAKQSVHWHNKAIFDSVNAELQTFRPFYTSEGEPFPWTNNLGMTHYDITQEALFIIFVQAKEKIQKQVITLCGMHLDFDDQNLPNPHQSKFYTKKMQEKEKKMVTQQAKQYDDKVDLDYITSGLRFEIAQEIFYELISQFQLEFFQKQDQEIVEEDYDFQYFN